MPHPRPQIPPPSPQDADLTDLSPPFGKAHIGKPMQDVPVSYLHYLWTTGKKHEQNPVARYIRANLKALEMENRDLDWT